MPSRSKKYLLLAIFFMGLIFIALCIVRENTIRREKTIHAFCKLESDLKNRGFIVNMDNKSDKTVENVYFYPRFNDEVLMKEIENSKITSCLAEIPKEKILNYCLSNKKTNMKYWLAAVAAKTSNIKIENKNQNYLCSAEFWNLIQKELEIER